jgi:taurine dioxygenase
MLRSESLPGPFGAAVEGLDLSASLPDRTVRALADLLYRHRFLLIRGQRLDKAQYARFGRRWGEPLLFFIPSHRDPQQPELIHVSNSPAVPEGQRDGAAHWHTDSSYETVPASVTMLHAIESPRSGGETQFADMVAAWEALPAATRERIRDLRVRHMVIGGKAMAGEKIGGNRHDEEVRRQRDKEMPLHPLVRRHPVTGHEALYAISGSACHIEGMEQVEGQTLLAQLKHHATQPRFIQSCKAEAGDILMWDNLSTLHSATPLEYSDEDGKRRLLYRISTRGLPDVYRESTAPAATAV